MTKEELKTDEPKYIIELVIKDKLRKEAEEWLSITDNHLNDERTHFLSESEYAEQAYLAGAEPREKRIAELKAQIEKMKCCGNCKYSNQESAYSIVCKVGGVDKSDYINIDDNQVCDKWEIKEK